jgi:hypothetical protein
MFPNLIEKTFTIEHTNTNRNKRIKNISPKKERCLPKKCIVLPILANVLLSIALLLNQT